MQPVKSVIRFPGYDSVSVDNVVIFSVDAAVQTVYAVLNDKLFKSANSNPESRITLKIKDIKEFDVTKKLLTRQLDKISKNKLCYDKKKGLTIAVNPKYLKMAKKEGDLAWLALSIAPHTFFLSYPIAFFDLFERALKIDLEPSFAFYNANIQCLIKVNTLLAVIGGVEQGILTIVSTIHPAFTGNFENEKHFDPITTALIPKIRPYLQQISRGHTSFVVINLKMMQEISCRIDHLHVQFKGDWQIQLGQKMMGQTLRDAFLALAAQWEEFKSPSLTGLGDPVTS